MRAVKFHPLLNLKYFVARDRALIFINASFDSKLFLENQGDQLEILLSVVDRNKANIKFTTDN